MKRRVLSVILSIIMALSLFPFSVLADTNPSFAIHRKDGASSSVQPGDEITFTLDLVSPTDLEFTSFGFILDYDTSVFTLKNIGKYWDEEEELDYLTNATFSLDVPSKKLAAASNERIKFRKANTKHTLADFTLQVNDAASVYNGNYDISATVDNLYNSPSGGDTQDLKSVATVSNATLTVTGASNPTLTQVALYTKPNSDYTVETAMADNWPTGKAVSVDGTNDVVFYAKGFAETAASSKDMTAGTTIWSTQADGKNLTVGAVNSDGYVPITIKAQAAEGTYEVSAVNGSTTKTLSFAVTHGDSTATSVTIERTATNGDTNVTTGNVEVKPYSNNDGTIGDAQTATVSYSAVVKDQFGVAMAQQPAVTWQITKSGSSEAITTGSVTLENAGNGTATVSVTSAAGAEDGYVTADQPTKDFTISASVEGSAVSATATMTIDRGTAVATYGQIKKGGNPVTTDTVTIPVSGDGETTAYTLDAQDQFGVAMTVTPEWTIEPSPRTGTTFANGTLTLAPNAEGATYEVQATAGRLTKTLSLTTASLSFNGIDGITTATGPFPYSTTWGEIVAIPESGIAPKIGGVVKTPAAGATYTILQGAGTAPAVGASVQWDVVFNGVVEGVNYTNVVVKSGTVQITPKALADDMVTVTPGDSVTFSGSAQTPTVTVMDGTTPLTEGTDYEVSYAPDTAVGNTARTVETGPDAGKPLNAGTYVVTVTGKGNYDESIASETEYVIGKASGSALSADDQILYSTQVSTEQQTYTGNLSNIIKTVASDAGSISYAVVSDGTTVTSTPTIAAGSPTLSFSYMPKASTSDAETVVVSVTTDNYTYNNVSISFAYQDLKQVNDLTLDDITVDYGTDYTPSGGRAQALPASATWNYTYEKAVGNDTYTAVPTEDLEDGKPYKAGTYRITASYTDSEVEGGIPGHIGSVKATLTINQLPVSLTWTSNTLAYDGTAKTQTATISNLKYGDTVTVSSYSYAVDTEVSSNSNAEVPESGAPSKAGAYTVTAAELSGDAKANYTLANATNLSKDYTIAGRDLSTGATVELTGELTYSGAGQTPDVTVKDGATTLAAGTDYTVAYAAKSGDSNAKVENNQAVNAGGYTATVTFAGNYAGTKSSDFTVAKKTVTVPSGVTASDKVYDGTVAATVNTGSAVIDGKVESDTLTISATGTFDTAEPGSAKNVTLHYGAFGGTSKDNYQLATEGNQETATATISRRPLTLANGTLEVTKEYDGTAGGWTIKRGTNLDFASAGTDTGVIAADADNVSVDAAKLSVITTGLGDADGSGSYGSSYQVTISGVELTGAAKDNYTVSSTYSFKNAQITKTQRKNAAISVMVGTTDETSDKTWEWTGSAATFGVSGNDESGNVTWSWGKSTDAEGVYSLTEQPTGAGSYKAKAVIAETANYAETTLTADFTITKKPITKPTASATVWTYTGVEQTYDVAAAAGYAVSGNKQTNAGTYEVTYTLTDADNTQWSDRSTDAVKLAWVIAKAPLTVTAAASTITYGEAGAPATANPVSYSGFVNNETVSVLGGTLAYDYKTANDGTGSDYAQGSPVTDKTATPNVVYYVIPKGLTSDNYDITFAGAEMTVSKKEVTGVNWGETALTYNAQEQKPVAVVKGLVGADAGKVSVVVTGGQTNANADQSGALLTGKTAYTATAGELSGEKAGNYSLPATKPTTSFTIQQIPVTISGIKATWDSAESKAVLSGGTINGLAGDDATKVAIDLPAANTPASTAPGNGIAVTADVKLKAAEAGGEAYTNYVLTSVDPITVDIPLENVEVAAPTVESATVSNDTSKVDTTKTEVVEVTDALAQSGSVSITDAGSDNGVKEAATAIASDDGVITESKVSEARTAVKELDSEAADEDIILVVKPVIDIVVEEVKTAENAVQSFKVDVSPYYELIATTKTAYNNGTGTLTDANSATLPNSKTPMTVNEPVRLSIPVPSTFNDHTVYIKHTHNNRNYEYSTSVTQSGGRYLAVFTATYGFSEFELSLESTSNFKIGEHTYDTLTAAVAAVQNGQTITVSKAMTSSEAVMVNRAVNFTVAESSAGHYKGTITAGADYKNKNASTVGGAAAGGYEFVKKLSAKATPASIASGRVNTSISQVTVTAENGTAPYSYSKTSGPDWLSVNVESGAVTGTRPAEAVDSPDSLVVTVTDAYNETCAVTISVGAVTAAQNTSGGSTVDNTSGNTGGYTGGGGGGGGGGSSGSSGSGSTVSSRTIKPSISLSGTTASLNSISDSDLSRASGNGSKSNPIVIDVSRSGGSVDSAKLPAELASKIAKLTNADGMSVKFNTATLTFDDNALNAIASAKGSTLTLSAKKDALSSLAAAQRGAVSNMDVKAVYTLAASVGSNEVSDFKNGTVTVVIPFTPASGTDASDYVLYYVALDGSRERVPAAFGNGEIRFTTNHFSNYVVAYEPAQFTDVVPGSFYEQAVAWAVRENITKGKDNATTFKPNDVCTRAEAVTFLYRAAGSPSVGSSAGFSDVPAGSYFENAVAWAVANGITNGKNGGFRPYDVCSRAEIVTFLARYEKAAAIMDDRFSSDVSSDAWYAGSVGWAVANGITKGKSDTKFMPNDTCTRAEIVTFLYRDFAK